MNPKGKHGSRATSMSLHPHVFEDVVGKLILTLDELTRAANEEKTHDPYHDVNLTAADAFAISYLRAELLSKFPGQTKLVERPFVKPEERREAAINKWLLMEQHNAQTNHNLILSASYDEDNEEDSEDAAFERLLDKAALVILDVIGSEPPEDLLSKGNFSAGASTTLPRDHMTTALKFMGGREVTGDCMNLAVTLLEECDTWRNLGWNGEFTPCIQDGNFLFTVPKNSQIDRVAAKEPDLNMFIQKAAGNYFRRCLKKKGIDLDDQTRNQSLARVGSQEGNLSTIDLSSASDTVSSQLVCRLLPVSWFTLLDSARSKRTRVDERWCDIHMFSSMGNGFTFELESLIFYALARACAWSSGVSGVISVYGDDIICPSVLAPMLLPFLGRCGFMPNLKKTFVTGPFRESCGKHYYEGSDVTPFYLRREWKDITQLIHFLNRLRRWILNRDFHKTEMRGLGGFDYSDFHVDWLLAPLFSLWEYGASLVPRSLHGGRDTESILQLVTPDEPISVLRPMKRERKTPETGAYIWWLRLAEGRKHPPEEALITSSVSIELENQYNLRKVNKAFHSDLPRDLTLNTEVKL